MGIGAWIQKNYNDGATGSRENFDDICRFRDTLHELERQTDGWTDTGRQQRLCLRIASWGKKHIRRRKP